MSIVNTTLGELNVDHLGAVDVHDHVIIDGFDNKNIPEDFNHMDVEKIASELISWKSAGGGVIVDASPIGAGRNVLLLEKTSRFANLPLIVCSGFHKLSYYPRDHWIHKYTSDQVVDILIDECSKGVLIDDERPDISERSKIKAGLLKIGVDASGVTPVISKIIAAVGKTINETGVRCMIHTEPGVPFMDVIRELKDNHIEASKVIFCHMGKSFDQELYQILAEYGYYLAFDEMVRSTPPLPVLVNALLELIKMRFGHLILFAGDMARRSYWPCYGGKPGLRYLLTGLHDDLIELGFTEQLLKNIWINNPQNFFCEL